MDENLIEKAKKYAREQKKSVSRVVSEYFSLLDHRFGQADGNGFSHGKILLGDSVENRLSAGVNA